MDASKLTSRSVEVINAASTLAVNEGNPQVEPVHLAVALLRQEQGITPSLLAKAGADVAEVEPCPRPGAVEPAPGLRLDRVDPGRLGRADAGARQGARPDQGHGRRLRRHRAPAARARGRRHPGEDAARPAPGRPRPPCAQAITAVRGNRQGHQPGRRGDLRGAGEVRRRPDRARRGGQARPGHRP